VRALSASPRSFIGDLVSRVSLSTLPADSLRLHISNSFAFVYEPVILESPVAAYIVDWGREKANQNVEEYIDTGASTGALHTLIFSARKVRLPRARVLKAASHKVG
jgi:hypothetical protein